MKRKLLALGLVFVLTLTACAPSGSTPAEDTSPAVSDSASVKQPLLGRKVKPEVEPAYPKSIGFDDYEGRFALREEYPVDEALWSSIDGFSARAASLALGDTEDNALFSPLSLWFALALCAESAEGDTRAALLDALGLPDEAAQSAKAVYNNLYKDNKIGSLKLSTSLWVNEQFPVKQEFLDLAADSFYAARACRRGGSPPGNSSDRCSQQPYSLPPCCFFVASVYPKFGRISVMMSQKGPSQIAAAL